MSPIKGGGRHIVNTIAPRQNVPHQLFLHARKMKIVCKIVISTNRWSQRLLESSRVLVLNRRAAVKETFLKLHLRPFKRDLWYFLFVLKEIRTEITHRSDGWGVLLLFSNQPVTKRRVDSQSPEQIEPKLMTRLGFLPAGDLVKVVPPLVSGV